MSAAPQKTNQHSRRRAVKEQHRRRAWLNDAQMAMGWLIVFGLAALLGTIYLSQASRIASSGRRMQILQSQLDTVKRDNADLEGNIASVQALDRLLVEAQNMGFRPADPAEIEYLVVPDFPTEALPQATPEPTRQPIETMQEAIFVAISSSLEGLGKGVANEP